jgi:hypothetical protein
VDTVRVAGDRPEERTVSSSHPVHAYSSGAQQKIENRKEMMNFKKPISPPP